MTSRERFYALLNNMPADRPAVINPVSVATSESVSALGLRFRDVHTDPAKAAALAAYPYEKLGFDSIMPYFSVVAEAAALGAVIDWGDDRTMPSQRSSVFTEPEQVKVPEDFLSRPSIRCVIEAIKTVSSKYGDGPLIIGKALGPWTLCLHCYGMEKTLIATIDDREKLKAMLGALASFTETFARAQLSAGAHMVTIADHSTRNLVGPKVYGDFVKPLHAGLNARFPGSLILHCCGNTEDRVGMFAEAGFPLYHFESSNDISLMIRKAGGMKLTGCVNNPATLLAGGVADVANSVAEIIRRGIDIVSPECAVPMATPNENLMAVACAAKNNLE